MMREIRCTFFSAGLMILALAGSGAAQPAHEPSTHPEAAGQTASDSRTALDLTPAVQAVMKQTMREHLEAIQAIVAALAQEQYDQAATIARNELGFPKHHEVMQREGGVPFPQKYQRLAMAHHQAAEDLAKVILTRDSKPILRQLDRTIKACVDCHQVYRLDH